MPGHYLHPEFLHIRPDGHTRGVDVRQASADAQWAHDCGPHAHPGGEDAQTTTADG
jgi:hypothetical protein